MKGFEGGGSGGSYVYSEFEGGISGGSKRALGEFKGTYVEEGVPTDSTAAGGEFEAIAGINDCFLRR